MLKKVKDMLFGNPFGNHFISKFSTNAKDEDAFRVFYSDRVMCVTMAHLMDLKVKVENERVLISNGNGEGTELTFKFHPPFYEEGENERNFISDMDSLIATSYFLVQEAKTKFGEDANAIQELTSLSHFMVNEINYFSKKDEFFADWGRNMLSNAYSAIQASRKRTNEMDLDLVLRASVNYVNWLNTAISMSHYSEIPYKQQIKAIYKCLRDEFNYPPEARDYEKYYIKDEEIDNYAIENFWNCVKTRKAIEEAKREGYEF